MVLASVCCSEETRAYRATRREADRAMVINLQQVVAGQQRPWRASGLRTGRPGRVQSQEAPTHRRDEETLVASASGRTHEPLGVWAENGGGQTWPTSFWWLRKAKEAKPHPALCSTFRRLFRPEASSRQDCLER